LTRKYRPLGDWRRRVYYPNLPIHEEGPLPDPQAADDRPERPELFISYASGDLDRADALHTRLAAEGFRVWFDKVRLTPGCHTVLRRVS
jgi:hypothetical protein